MRRILIFKLTRMGDILEAAPLLRAIRLVEPASHVTMVVNETFRETASLLADVDRLVSFPFFDFAHDLREGEDDLVDLYRRIEAFTDQLSAEPYDLVLNVTNSQLSGMLVGFVKTRQWRGLRYDERGGRQVLGALVRYFGANDVRRHNPFNLSDFMIALYGNPGRPLTPNMRIPETAEAEATALLATAGDAPLLGLQAGASETCKRWNIGDFATTSRLLIEQSDARVVLLGAGDERPLADALLDRLPGLEDRVIDLVGKTSVSTLAAVVRRLGALLSNDTGTMHLAAALGVKVINLSLGSAYFRETAPYGPGHLVVEPRIDCRPCQFFFECGHFDCKRLVPPDYVADLALSLLRGEDGLEVARRAPDTLDVFRTGIDEDGLLECVRQRPRPLRADEVILQVYRVVICQSEFSGELGDRLELMRRRLLQEGGTLRAGEDRPLRALGPDLARLEQLVDRGVDLAAQAREAVQEGATGSIQTLLRGMEGVEREILRFNQEHPDCRLLVRGFLLELESMRGLRLEVLLGGHLACYRRLQSCLRWAREALDCALALLDPVPAPAQAVGSAG